MKPSPAQLLTWPDVPPLDPDVGDNEPRCAYCGALWPGDEDHTCPDLERVRAEREDARHGNR